MGGEDVDPENNWLAQLFEQQVCMVISDSCRSCEPGILVEQWEIQNAELFAQEMMWDAAYVGPNKNFLVGWAPDHSEVCGGICDPGSTGKLFVLRADRCAHPRVLVTRDVRLSRSGCYCAVVDGEGEVWIIYPEVSGCLMHIMSERSGARPSGVQVQQGALHMCSQRNNKEIAILFSERISIYMVTPNSPGSRIPPTITACYSVPIDPSNLRITDYTMVQGVICACPLTQVGLFFFFVLIYSCNFPI